MERRGALTTSFFHAHGCILVFDLTDAQSLNKMEDTMHDLRRRDEEMPVLLVGNKCDLTPKVTPEGVTSWAAQHNLEYFEVSAKCDINIKAVFDRIALLIRESPAGKKDIA